MSCGVLNELQVLQNDILRICTRNRLADKISMRELHKKCKILSLKQQLLGLMSTLSKDPSYLYVPVRNTRRADKIVFIVPTRIRPFYESSPYYIGCNMWDKLDKETQSKENMLYLKRK